MGKIIDFEFMICPLCGHRVPKFWFSHLVQDAPCPECNKGKVYNFGLFTSNSDKYKGLKNEI